MNNPATNVINEIIEASKLPNRTKQVLGPESAKDRAMYNSQHPDVKQKIYSPSQGDGGTKESLDSNRKINSESEETGDTLASPSVDIQVNDAFSEKVVA